MDFTAMHVFMYMFAHMCTHEYIDNKNKLLNIISDPICRFLIATDLVVVNGTYKKGLNPLVYLYIIFIF